MHLPTTHSEEYVENASTRSKPNIFLNRDGNLEEPVVLPDYANRSMRNSWPFGFTSPSLLGCVESLSVDEAHGRLERLSS